MREKERMQVFYGFFGGESRFLKNNKIMCIVRKVKEKNCK